jgi:RHS repeat-associated protein
VYDGWNLAAELKPNSSLIRSYVWGTDLSGQFQGAGGVGGLLETRYFGTYTTNAFAAFDGNGNVSALVNATDGTVVANYEYGPFGEVVRNSGPLAKNNPLRFSTKYQDDESDLLNYGYRYYNLNLGRWICRDRIGEVDCPNIYEFVKNDGIDFADFLGDASLEFDTVVGSFHFGSWGRGNSGRWSQPAYAGWGRIASGADWAESEVMLSNNELLVHSADFCNSVYWFDPSIMELLAGRTGFADAGSILVVLSDCQGGNFRVTGNYEIRGGGEGPRANTYGYGMVRLYEGPPVGGSPVLLYRTARGYFRVRRQFSIDVHLAPNERKVILTHDVELTLPEPVGGDTTGGVFGKFDGVTVEAMQ